MSIFKGKGFAPRQIYYFAAFVIICATPAPLAVAAEHYRVSLLGNIGTTSRGETGSSANGINFTGDTVGYAEKWLNDIDIGDRAVRWAANQTVPEELGTLGTNNVQSTESHAYAIDAAGNAVGFAEKWSGSQDLGRRPVIWKANQNSATELDIAGVDPLATNYNDALAISTTGNNIAGVMNTLANTTAVRWMGGDNLGTLLKGLGTNSAGVTSSSANAINASGDAVGSATKWSGDTSLNDRAVKWAAGETTPIELGNLGTNASKSTISNATAINNSGDIAGWALRYDGAPHSTGPRAVRWAAGQTAATELNTLGTNATGFGNSSASGINAAGDVVGTADKYVNNVYVDRHATLWRGGQIGVIDLNDLINPASGWDLNQAQAITDDGVIVGYGNFDPDGAGPILTRSLAFRLTPSLMGDANDDGTVNFADLVAVAQHYGKTSGATWEDGDFNFDGKVEFADLVAVAQNYGVNHLKRPIILLETPRLRQIFHRHHQVKLPAHRLHTLHAHPSLRQNQKPLHRNLPPAQLAMPNFHLIHPVAPFN